MTQEQLAAVVKLEPITISRFERGARALSIANTAAVAGALGVGLARLFDVDVPASSPDDGEYEWRALWAQLPVERRVLAVRMVKDLAKP
jgi:transcriptional regulator with XRE-family HTH domain